MLKFLEIGQIINTHGVKGEVKIYPLTDDARRFLKLNWVYIKRNDEMTKYNIQSVKFLKNLVIIKFEGINDMTEAETFKNCKLLVDRENAVKLPEDSYFICDIIGCEVFEENGQRLGVVKNVLKTGSNDVYELNSDRYRELLIPAIKSAILDVDIENKKIIVKLPEGLVDDEI